MALSVDKRYNLNGFILDKDKAFIEANIKGIREISNNIFEVTPANEYRLDLISFEIYNTVQLKWLLIYVNDIVDISELGTGKQLVFPLLRDVTTIALRQLEVQ